MTDYLKLAGECGGIGLIPDSVAMLESNLARFAARIRAEERERIIEYMRVWHAAYVIENKGKSERMRAWADMVSGIRALPEEPK